MPLPPAPSRRAALLAPEAFDITAPPRAAATSSAADAEVIPLKAPATGRSSRKPATSALTQPPAAAAPLEQVETRARLADPAPAARGRARSTPEAAPATARSTGRR
ncbi:PhoH family protein, partial [Paracidovorax sp. MALMAid1276]